MPPTPVLMPSRVYPTPADDAPPTTVTVYLAERAVGVVVDSGGWGETYFLTPEELLASVEHLRAGHAG